MDWYMGVWKKFAVFDGRARRKEYWVFSSINMFVLMILYIVDVFIFPILFLMVIFYFAIFLPSLAVCVRRLHDIGKSGWWMLLSFVPIVGAIWLLVLFLTDSTPNENKYGPNPKQAFLSPVEIPYVPGQVPAQQPIQVSAPRTATLAGITGPYAGQQIPVPRDGIIMGRDASLCNLPVKSSSVSRKHARLYYGAGQDSLILEDLGSTNGTFILNNTSWTRISSPITLTTFGRFRLGDSENEFEIR